MLGWVCFQLVAYATNGLYPFVGHRDRKPYQCLGICNEPRLLFSSSQDSLTPRSPDKYMAIIEVLL